MLILFIKYMVTYVEKVVSRRSVIDDIGFWKQKCRCERITHEVQCTQSNATVFALCKTFVEAKTTTIALHVVVTVVAVVVKAQIICQVSMNDVINLKFLLILLFDKSCYIRCCCCYCKDNIHSKKINKLFKYEIVTKMGSLLSFYCQFFATQIISGAKELVILLWLSDDI